MSIVNGLISAIGNTPLIRINSLSEETGCEILGKAEFMNPGGSVKDRAALWMVQEAEKDGSLKPGGTVVEGTAVIRASVWPMSATTVVTRPLFTCRTISHRKKSTCFAHWAPKSAWCLPCPTPMTRTSRNRQDDLPPHWITRFGPISSITPQTACPTTSLRGQKSGPKPTASRCLYLLRGHRRRAGRHICLPEEKKSRHQNCLSRPHG